MFCWSLGYSAESVELQFVTGESAHFTSVTSVFKALKTQNLAKEALEFYNHQGVEAFISLEERCQEHPLANFPFELSITLKNIKLNLKNRDHQICYDSNNCLEMSEAKALLGKPLKFTLKHLDEPLSFYSTQRELCENLSLFEPAFLQGLFEEDLKDLFSLAGKTLKIGEVFQVKKQVDQNIPFEMIKEYKITEITPDKIYAEVNSKLVRQKQTLETFVSPVNSDKDITIVVLGESKGKIAWNRQNSLYFTLEEMGSYHYSIKALGVLYYLDFEIEKEVLSSPEEKWQV